MFIWLMPVAIYASEDQARLNFKKGEVEHRTGAVGINIATNSVGDVLIGFDDGAINVYDNKGTFKSSYTFDVDGAYVATFDALDHLVIYTVRGNTYYTFNSEGEFLGANEEVDLIKADKYYRDMSSRKTISVGTIEYRLQNVWGYTKLVKVDANEIIVYETGNGYIANVVIAVCAILLVLSVIIYIINLIVRERKNV